jgi:hypothetical protein
VPAYDFRERFAADVEAGWKRSTIRPKRKRRPTRPGDTLYLFTGQRTKHCRRLGEHVCRDVTPVDIGHGWVRLGGQMLGGEQVEELARADGFADSLAFFAFFAEVYGLPLLGRMERIRW